MTSYMYRPGTPCSFRIISAFWQGLSHALVALSLATSLESARDRYKYEKQHLDVSIKYTVISGDPLALVHSK